MAQRPDDPSVYEDITNLLSANSFEECRDEIIVMLSERASAKQILFWAACHFEVRKVNERLEKEFNTFNAYAPLAIISKEQRRLSALWREHKSKAGKKGGKQTALQAKAERAERDAKIKAKADVLINTGTAERDVNSKLAQQFGLTRRRISSIRKTF